MSGRYDHVAQQKVALENLHALGIRHYAFIRAIHVERDFREEVPLSYNVTIELAKDWRESARSLVVRCIGAQQIRLEEGDFVGGGFCLDVDARFRSGLGEGQLLRG